MTARQTFARNLRSGDTILTDPLDSATAADVVDVYRSEFAATVELTIRLADGRLALMTLANDQPVRRISVR